MKAESPVASSGRSQSPSRTQSPDRGRPGWVPAFPIPGRAYRKTRVLEVPIQVDCSPNLFLYVYFLENESVLGCCLSERYIIKWCTNRNLIHFLLCSKQVWRKYGFVLLWAAVGLDLIFSVMGHPFLGQAISAIFVIIYLFDHVRYFVAAPEDILAEIMSAQVSLRRVVCSVWFAIIDLYFREISVGGSHKLESLKDGRYHTEKS
jgi:hypothetical protein